MIKIGFDANGILGFSGIETYTRELIKNLGKFYPVHQFLLYTPKSEAEELKKFFPETKNIIYDSSLYREMLLGKHGKFIVKMMNENIWVEKSKVIDLIHQTNQFFIHKKVRNIVATVHDLIPLNEKIYHKPIFTKRYRKKLTTIVKYSRLIYVPSEYVKQELLRYFDYDSSKICVTHLAANPIFKPCPITPDFLKRYNLPHDFKYFLYVGRLDSRKNLDKTLLAYSRLHKDIKHEYSFIIVARSTSKDLINLLDGHAKLLDNERIIHIQGAPEDDLVKFYSGATAFLMPSYAEGFGLPILEAMQCGCPAITSPITSMPEIGANAVVYVDPDNIEEIKNSMQKLVEDISFKNRLIQLGFERVKEFSWQNTAEKTMQGYMRVIEQG